MYRLAAELLVNFMRCASHLQLAFDAQRRHKARLAMRAVNRDTPKAAPPNRKHRRLTATARMELKGHYTRAAGGGALQ